MSANRPAQTQLHRQRRRRVVGACVASLTAWAALSGIPFTADATSAGEMTTEIVNLTGPDAQPTAPAGASADARAAAPDEADPGWSATIEVDEGTQAVAASWLGAPEGIVSVRGRTPGGWTEWTDLQADPDERPDDAERDSAGMVWFGSDGVDEVEAKVLEGELEDFEVQVMRYEAASSNTIFGGAEPAGAAAAQPTIMPRSAYTSKGWASNNSGCASGPITASGGIKYAVVHHTVNSNTYSASDVPAILASTYAYHTGTNGWCDIGYNFLIDRFGTIWEGRSGGIDKAIVGGHAAGFNTGSMGVSFIGQFEPGASPAVGNPTTTALQSAGELIGWKLGREGIDPTGTVSVTSGGSNRWPSGTVLQLPRVIGHRDVGYTACPGANLYDDLDSIRLRAKAAQGSTTTTTTTTTTTPPSSAYRPFTSANGLVQQQYSDVLRRSASSSELSYWTPRVGNSWSPSQFVTQLLTSDESNTRVHSVIRLYQAYFKRIPDHAGLDFWLSKRSAGATLDSISASFAKSAEFTSTYGQLGNASFVERVYQNVLDRPSDPGGLDYWKARLDNGMSRGKVMTNFSESPEYVAQTASGAQIIAVYEALLRRPVANDVYTLFVAGMDNSSTTINSVTNYVYSSAEYESRFG